MKKDVIELNKDLFVLQEELLFPANTQVAVYVSMDVGTFFALDSVTIKIDNKEVKNYLYTAREADALLKGGVQRALPRQPEGRQASSSSHSSRARARSSATTGAAPPSTSRRASARSIWNSRSPTACRSTSQSS